MKSPFFSFYNLYISLSLSIFQVNGMFYYNVHIKENIAFNIIALFVEVHTFCLHWRKLLQMVGTPYNTRKYVIVKYLNLGAFAIFRFGATFTITWGIFTYHNLVTWTYYICICLSMFFMNILNFVLFWRLLRSDVLRKRSEVNGSACRNIQKDCQALSGYELLSTEGTMGHDTACKKTDWQLAVDWDAHFR